MRECLIVLRWVWTNDEICARAVWSRSCLDSHSSHLCIETSFSEQSRHEIAFHVRTQLGGKGTYIQIMELRSSLESTTSDNEAMSMLIS